MIGCGNTCSPVTLRSETGRSWLRETTIRVAVTLTAAPYRVSVLTPALDIRTGLEGWFVRKVSVTCLHCIIP